MDIKIVNSNEKIYVVNWMGESLKDLIETRSKLEDKIKTDCSINDIEKLVDLDEKIDMLLTSS